MRQITNHMPTAELQALDAAHHMHPFTANGALAQKGARIITRAEGVWLTDSDGHRIIDGMAGLWCVNVGYARKDMAAAAARQMEELPYYNTFFQTSHVPAIALAARIAELAPGDLNQVFFACSGSEANDTNLRMVRQYWALKGQPERSIVISRKNGYHGSTMGGGSLGGMSAIHAQGGLPIPGIVHIDQPHWYLEGGDMTPEDFGLARARQLEEKILELGADKVAAFIAEPIQGAGGVIVPPATYWPEIQRIVDKYGILLIVDEVITGFGRTGNWFGSQTYDIAPDIMTVAKGLSSGYLPISGVMLGSRIADVLVESGDWHHGFTYSGHPVSAAVALKNLEIMEREGLVEKVAKDTGPYLKHQLATLADHPLVGEVRSFGLLGAIELVKDKKTRARWEPPGTAGGICRDHCISSGLLMRACVDTMVMSPPLVISRAEIDELVGSARAALDGTLAVLKG